MSLPDIDLPTSRILLLRQGGLGDALVAVPIVRALRQALPVAKIDILLSRRNHVIAPAYRPYVGTIWNYTKRPWQTLTLFAALHRRHYDLAIDLIDAPSTTSRLLLRVSGARVRLGIGRRPESVYTDAAPSLMTPEMHIVERLSQVLVPLGIDPATVPLELEFPLSAADQETARVVLGPNRGEYRIGINLSGGFAAKYWGRDNFIALVRQIRARHPEAEVLVLGALDYAEEVSAIAAAADARAVPPVPSFGVFAALLHECDLLVTPDTSVSHLAAAWKKPAVVLFIQSASNSTTLWAPFHSPHRALWHAERVAGIPVAAVAAALDELLGAYALRKPAACH
ncbi:MAG: glycosyltransferase family 9 protein [Gemmatimonadota bacterium]